MNTKGYGILVLLIVLISCNDNVVKEKDKYPEIPNFPEFKDAIFESEKIAEIRLKLNKDFKNQNNEYYFRYLVTDSTVYFITFYTDSDHPDYPYRGENYTVDLLVIDGDNINQSRSIDKDFDFNFDLDKERNLTIAKRKFTANTNYKEYELAISADTKVDTLFKSWKQRAYIGLNTSELKAFDEVIIGSKGGLGGNETMPIFSLEYDAVPLTYYELNYKGKRGLTKIDFRNELYPLTIRTANALYYVTYKQDYVDIENQTKIFSFYRID